MYTLVMAAFFTLAVFSSYQRDNTSEQPKVASSEMVTANDITQSIKAVDLDRPFDFAGESLPMDNFDARERLDRELMRNTYWHSNTALNLKKAARYFPIIEPILAEHGVPDDLKYLAVAESDLRMATSPAGAKGIWQFMRGTGKEYGLEVRKEVDERYHVEKSTHAACKMLQSYKERFGSWTLAAAGYNMGASGLKKEMDTQRGQSFYDLNLNQETMRYIFRIVAIKDIMQEPERYGFQIDQIEKYPPLEEYNNLTVSESINNLGDFAQKYGTTYRMLKVYNPWLTSSKLTNTSGKSYDIRIPKQK